MDFDPKLTKRHFRAVIYTGFLKLCREKYPHIDVDELCIEAGLPRSYLEVESNWVSVIFANRFTKLLIKQTGNENISFDAGMQSVTPELVGRPLYQFCLYLLSTRLATMQFVYHYLPDFTGRFNAVSRLQVIGQGPNFICYRFSVQSSLMDEEELDNLRELYDDIISNTLGYYSTVASLKKLPPPRIDIVEIPSAGSELPAQDIRIEWASENIATSAILALAPLFFGALIILFTHFTFPGNSMWSWVMGLGGALLFSTLSNWRQLSAADLAFKATVDSLRETERRYTDVYRSNEKNKRLSSTYKRFVPNEILTRLDVRGYEDLRVGLARRGRWTAFFCDIRGFTSLAEKRSASEIFRVLNSYYEIVNSMLDKHRGHLDSYSGDGFFAVFPNCPQDAVEAGVQLLNALAETDFASEGERVRLKVGIGISTGDMVLGTVGGANRMQVTHVSDAVNLASRLEAFTKQADSPLIVDSSTFHSLKPFYKDLFKHHGLVRLPGKEDEVPVWELKPHLAGSDENSLRIVPFKRKD